MHANAALLGLNLNAASNSNNNNNRGNTSVALVNPMGVRKLASPMATSSSSPPPYTCVDGKVIATDPNNTYGYFQHRIVSKSKHKKGMQDFKELLL